MAVVFAPGTVLGGRFELHGVVGRGGTAEVWLATDRLRGERVALKIVHAHLASDPDARRRLQREVGTAALLRSPAALVPYDLHESDGVLALSMPFHPGQTLAERIATSGPLAPDQVRALGIRLATALADAHRAGILHRDVTANNVLVGDAIVDSVLTDFGLSRLLGSSRSTGLLGTAGYAAPEVYAGSRADPRSDLYGLGGVLFLALTGRPAFDPKDPMSALRAQIDESQPQVRALAPNTPADLAELVDQLLRADPVARPQGAREVLDALTRAEAPRPARAAEVEPTPVATARGLPQGRFTVIVRERSEDRARRHRLRRQASGERSSTEDELARWGRHLADRVRDALGVPPPTTQTPEMGLHAAMAERAGADRLEPTQVVLERKFRLFETTDEETATHLANRAVAVGFKADAVEVVQDGGRSWGRIVRMGAMILGWVELGRIMEVMGPQLAILAMIAFTVAVTTGFRNVSDKVRERDLRRLPIAYPQAVLGPAKAAPIRSQAHVAAAPVEASRGDTLRDRALAAIGALEVAADQADLPDPARADLRSSTKRMRARAAELGADVDRIERAMVGVGDAADVAALRTRLARMETLARAGERVDGKEQDRIRKAIAEHEADQDAADRLESELASATASLLELASTASRLRRELAMDRGDPASADEIVAKLSRETRAAMDARREAGIRAAQAGRSAGAKS